jgi:hypothetical protein
VASGNTLKELKGHGGPVGYLSFTTPDGKYLLAATTTTTTTTPPSCTVWDTSTWCVLASSSGTPSSSPCPRCAKFEADVVQFQRDVTGLEREVARLQGLVVAATAEVDDLRKALLLKDTEISVLRQQLRDGGVVGALCAGDRIDPTKPYVVVLGDPAPPQPAAPPCTRPTLTTSPLHVHVEMLTRTRGAFSKGCYRPIAGFTLVGVDVVVPTAAQVVVFEERLRVLSERRKNPGGAFNPEKLRVVEKQEVLHLVHDLCCPPLPGSQRNSARVVHTFHGTRVGLVQALIASGLASLGTTDEGFFGAAIYTTPNMDYAAAYARGDFDTPTKTVRAGRPSDGAYPVLLLACAVGLVYPITRPDDYAKRTDGYSDYFGAPMRGPYDCHAACVDDDTYQAVPVRDAQYVELAVQQESSLIPLAVLWMKSM